MAPPDGAPRASNRVRASLSFLVIMALTGAWLYASRNVSPAEAARLGGTPQPATLPGFLPELGYLPDDAALGFVEIPAGPFRMGSDPARDPMAFENEVWPGTGGTGEVDLPAFRIGRFEVTVAQYRAFVEDTGHPVADTLALLGAPTLPVRGISWPDALAYARWLEARLRASPRTPPEIRALLEDGWRITLPTEAQWEKAARGTDGRIYPWGDEPRRDRANFMAVAPRPVGSFECPECAYGLADMAGNVWELTRSPYQPLPYDPADDAADLAADALWVMRGGAFSDNPQLVRAAVRGGADPGARRPFIGFRLVLSPD